MQGRFRILTSQEVAASAAVKSLWRRGGGAGRRFSSGFTLQLYFACGTFFTPSAIVGNCQLIVACGIVGHDLYVFLERGDGLGKVLRGGQRHPQGEVRFRETGIEARCGREMRDGFVPLSGAARDFAQGKLRCGVAGIDL